MAIEVKDSGIWKVPTAVSAKDGGTWKAATVSVNRSGTWEQVWPVAPSFTPYQLDFWHEWDAVQSGWVTTTGGDGNQYLTSAPNLGTGTAGSLAGLTTGASAGDIALATPIGWRINDAGKGVQIQTAERSLVTSMGAANLVGTGSMFDIYCFTDGGSSNNNTRQGSGASFTVQKYETVSGTDRMKYTDGFNTQADGLGTATNDAIFNFSPQPVNGNKIFMAAQRDVDNDEVIFYFSVFTSSTAYSTIQRVSSKDLATPLFMTNPRNNTQQNVSYFFNETTTLHAIGRGAGVLTEPQMEAIFEHCKTRFA